MLEQVGWAALWRSGVRDGEEMAVEPWYQHPKGMSYHSWTNSCRFFWDRLHAEKYVIWVNSGLRTIHKPTSTKGVLDYAKKSKTTKR